MVLLAAFAALLSRISGDPDVVVGVSTAGRDTAELAPLIGMFVNPVALRCDLDGDPRFTELLGRVRDGLVDAMEHGQTPFQRSSRRSPRSGTRRCSRSSRPRSTSSRTPGCDPVPLGTTKDDLAFDMTTGDQPAGLPHRAVRPGHRRGGRRPATSGCSHAAVADPEQRVSALPLLDRRRAGPGAGRLEPAPARAGRRAHRGRRGASGRSAGHPGRDRAGLRRTSR